MTLIGFVNMITTERIPAIPPELDERPSSAHAVEENLPYRLKSKLLGEPLLNEDLQHERLGNATALAVFASDNLSSCAYATEEILRVLVPAIGLAAFTLVTPVTIALLVVLGFLILSYRQTIKAYPSAGGAYIVTRDNFGIMPAQVAGVALLTDYVLTVSVSVAAGTDALASAVPAIDSFKLPIAIGFIVLIAYVNLRGVKESGKLFAVPTYFFVGCMGVLLSVGAWRVFFGNLPVYSPDAKGLVDVGSKGNGLLLGASAFIVLKAFGSGGAAVTGVEAISNGVPAFKEPAWHNARKTLVIMGGLLAVMFLGLSLLAAKVHATPYVSGSPTVISLVGKAVFGPGPFGKILYFALQAGTMLILVLAANTSFADFPRLASFHAGDNFMPRQFMVRGHRLVFSNGVIFLSGAAIVTLLGTGGKVSRLIPLYAIGVFTSFTLSQAGMAKHHITHKEPKWKMGLFINAMGALLSFIVLLIVGTVKFTEGAWVIVLLIPIMVYGLVRMNRAYTREATELAGDAHAAAQAPTAHRHVVLVLVDELDVAAARAIHYGRTLLSDELRVVHFDLDPWKSHQLVEQWGKLGLSNVPLEIIECPDRRLANSTARYAAEIVGDDGTELSVLIARREYASAWHRLLHDRSSSGIISALTALPNCHPCIVPYHLGSSLLDDHVDGVLASPDAKPNRVAKIAAPNVPLVDGSELPTNRVRITEASLRTRVSVAGRVRSVRIQPWGGSPSLECTIVDDSGTVTLVFLGRRAISGIRVGTVLAAVGTITDNRGKRAILNPTYTLVKVADEPHAPMH